MTAGSDSERVLTVGICSRNRPVSLARCLRSLALIEPLVANVVVVDDGSEPALEPLMRAELGDALPPRITFIRQAKGLTAGRNRIAREAATPWLLNLDDDALIVTAAAIEQGLDVISGDPRVAAVGFAQTDDAGVPWPAGAQAAPVDYPCWVPAFIGFAHLLRREAFIAVGGYTEEMGINGEEKDLCMRLLAAGGGVVYLPGAGVAHLADATGRDMRVYLHQTTRNDVLGSVRNDPLPVLALTGPMRLLRYFRMRKGWKIHDPGGFGTLLREVADALPSAVSSRRPLALSVWREWRRLRTHPPYDPPAGAGSAAT